MRNKCVCVFECVCQRAHVRRKLKRNAPPAPPPHSTGVVFNPVPPWPVCVYSNFFAMCIFFFFCFGRFFLYLFFLRNGVATITVVAGAGTRTQEPVLMWVRNARDVFELISVCAGAGVVRASVTFFEQRKLRLPGDSERNDNHPRHAH